MDRRAAQLSEIAALVQTDFTGKDVLIQGLGLCNRTSEYRSVLSYVASADFLKIAESNPAVQALVIAPELYQKALSLLLIRRNYFMRFMKFFSGTRIFINYPPGLPG